MSRTVRYDCPYCGAHWVEPPAGRRARCLVCDQIVESDEWRSGPEPDRPCPGRWLDALPVAFVVALVLATAAWLILRAWESPP